MYIFTTSSMDKCIVLINNLKHSADWHIGWRNISQCYLSKNSIPSSPAIIWPNISFVICFQFLPFSVLIDLNLLLDHLVCRLCVWILKYFLRGASGKLLRPISLCHSAINDLLKLVNECLQSSKASVSLYSVIVSQV